MADASNIYNGKLMRYRFDDKKLMHATSCSLDVSTKLEEIATKDTDGTETVPANYSWSGSTEALLSKLPVGDTTHVTSDDILAKQLAGTPIDIDFSTDATGDIMWSGTAYIESCKITADTGSAVKVSISFKGSGNLTASTVSA